MEVILSLAWGLVVLFSFSGLGQILARVMTPGFRPDPFLAGGWGMAGMIFIGGLLNLLGVARSGVLIALILAIIFLRLLIDGYERWSPPGNGEQAPIPPSPSSPGNPHGRRNWIWMTALVLLVAVKYVSCLTHFGNFYDDKPAYLYETAHLLQTGSLGSNPFSDRQLLSLNGQQFLVGLLLSVVPAKHAFLLDPGICWIIIAGFSWSMIRRDLHGSIEVACALTALVLMVASPPGLNLGGNLTGAVLCLALVWTTYLGSRADGHLDWGSLLLLSLIFAGLCAVKTTFFVFAVLFIAIWQVFRMLHSPSSARVRELFLVGVVGTAFLAPWMWQQYQSSGTLLYPFLGNGTHLSAPGLEIFGDSRGTKLKAVLRFLFGGEMMPVVLGLILLAKNPIKEDPTRWHAWLASLVAALLASSISMYQLGTPIGYAYLRYSQPILYSALIPVGLWGFFGPRNSRGALALCLALFVGNRWENVYSNLGVLRALIAGEWTAVLAVSDHDAKQVRDAQASIPAGGKILASVVPGALLDFSRNPIWNLDQPGMASPPPGIPLPADPSALNDFISQRTTKLPVPHPSDDLLRYLRNVGIEFLIFKQGAPDGRDEPRWFLQLEPTEEPPRWNRVIHTMARLVYMQLYELKGKCPILYDDGDVVALDLRPGTRSQPARVAP